MGSRTVDTPSDNLQCFLYVYLFVAGHNNIHHPLPSAPASLTHKCDFSKIFSNFQNILVAFFHIDKPIDFLEKTLAIVQLEDVSSTAPRASARSDSRRSAASLGVCSWTFKYKHNSSVNMRIVCYSDAGSALNETNIAKTTAYSHFLV